MGKKKKSHTLIRKTSRRIQRKFEVIVARGLKGKQLHLKEDINAVLQNSDSVKR